MFTVSLPSLAGLPLVNITTSSAINAQKKVQGTMKVTNSDATCCYDGSIGIKWRGNSSLSFDQKKYTLELRDDAGNDRDASLLGMPAESDWVLLAPYNDISMLRDPFAFQLWRDMGHWAPRTSYCEVSVNGEYMGIYILSESIKRGPDRVNISKLKKSDVSGRELTGGYIVRVDAFDQDDATFTSAVKGIQTAFAAPETGFGGGFPAFGPFPGFNRDSLPMFPMFPGFGGFNPDSLPANFTPPFGGDGGGFPGFGTFNPDSLPTNFTPPFGGNGEWEETLPSFGGVGGGFSPFGGVGGGFSPFGGVGGGFGTVTWTVYYPKKKNLQPQQMDYIHRYIDQVEQSFQQGNYQQWIDLPSFVDYFIHTELSLNADGYKRSAYFYKDKDAADGTVSKLQAGPVWDYNLAFGNCNFCSANDPEAWVYEGCYTNPTPAFWKQLAEDADFMKAVKKRYAELRRSLLSQERINDYIDHVARQLGEAKERHFAKYSNLFGDGWANPAAMFAAYTVTSYEEEIATLKMWFATRLAFLDSQWKQ
ncbi:MAG: CotH kinase family protein [Prevotella sp.]|nr:CotH kinase family protein [Prevotella sp.]